ncbi:MAG: hypothetical protein KKD90_07445 [Candidatus Omnitrophica bacterium]|nr:hypothetical protein [Candidatus Omnitrophota bacterium]
MTRESKATGIKTWPEDDRPREKLLKKGARVLSNSELLAILLRTGTNGSSAIDLARKVMKKFGTFRNMTHTDVRDWMEGLLIKHKAFNFENEFRVICDTFFLSEEGKLKDNEINEIYVKFSKDAIREVILSPGSSDKTKHMVEDLLKKYDYKCEVRKSIVDMDSI